MRNWNDVLRMTDGHKNSFSRTGARIDARKIESAAISCEIKLRRWKLQTLRLGRICIASVQQASVDLFTYAFRVCRCRRRSKLRHLESGTDGWKESSMRSSYFVLLACRNSSVSTLYTWCSSALSAFKSSFLNLYIAEWRNSRNIVSLVYWTI